MSSNLDMSLDDIIRNNRGSRGDKGNFRGRGPGPDRRGPSRGLIRPNPYLMRQPLQVQEPMTWQREMLLSGTTNPEEGTKLYISNLDYGVTNDDIKVLFSEVGDIKRHAIHYDRSGRSKGTAEVVFYCQTDALAAMKRYNNVQLDGKPLKIEIVGVDLITPAPVLPTQSSILGKPTGGFARGLHRIGARGWAGGGAGDGRGSGSGHSHGCASARNRGRGSRYGEKLSAEELDAELEKYHIEAMQTN